MQEAIIPSPGIQIKNGQKKTVKIT